MMKSLLFIVFFLTFFGMLSAYAQAGSPDPDFGGGDGLVSTTFFDNIRCQGFGITVQEDGRMVVSGDTRAADGQDHAFVARYLPDGSFDNSFNGNGKILIEAPGTYSSSRAVKVQADGRIVVIVESDDSLEARVSVFRYLTDGSPDNSFDGDGNVTTSLGVRYLGAKTMAIQQDGKILVAGYAGYENDLFDEFFIVRYLPNGALDNSFDGDGIVKTLVGESYTNIASLLVQPDGKIIAAGYAVFNDNDEFALVRYNANGTLDHSFSGDGIAMASFGSGDDRAGGAVLQPDGKIVLGGYAFSNITGEDEFAVARFNSDGTLDNTFHGDGMVRINLTSHSDDARSVLLQPDGKILLGGFAHADSNLGTDMAVIRLNDNGIPDQTFDGDGVFIYEDGMDTTSIIHHMAMQPDGKIVCTGYARTNGLNQISVLRILTGLTTATDEISSPVNAITLYPNPSHDKVVLQYNLESAGILECNLCDLQGRIVQQLMPPTERNAGDHIENLNIRQGLLPGNYFVTIQTGTEVKAVKVTLQ